MDRDLFAQDRPAIDGLDLRPIRVEDGELAALAELINAAARVDGLEWVETADALRSTFAHPSGWDPDRDYQVAWVGDRLVGGAWVQRRDRADGQRVYSLRGRVHPDWRRRGLGRWLLRGSIRMAQADERRDPIAVGPAPVAQAMAPTTSPTSMALLEAEGFSPKRHIFLMTRPLDGNYPDFRLPADLAIRPVGRERMRDIWEADTNAFRDHWGFSEPTEADFAQYLENDALDPALFKVAFDANGAIAGQVQNFIDARENAAYGRLRGYTEDISTARKHRRRGVARALIVESLRMLESLGMREAALHVDTANPTGALSVYEACGYTEQRDEILYWRPLFA